MQKLQCELCGSIDIVRTDDGFFMCRHCGCKYTLEQAKAMLGTVETTIGTAELNRLLKNAQTQADIGRLSEAESTYTEVTKQFPDDYRGWLGLLKVNCKIYLDGKRIYLPGHKFNSSPLESEAAQLFEWYGICQNLAPAEETEKIKAEWESFWDAVAGGCASGKIIYKGTDNLDYYKDTSPAMYDYVKSGFENARIINSLNAVYSPKRGQWVLRSPFDFPYLFWVGPYIITDDCERLGRRSSQVLLPIDGGYIAAIKSDIQKYTADCITSKKCPYCGVALKKTLFKTTCPKCGRSY